MERLTLDARSMRCSDQNNQFISYLTCRYSNLTIELGRVTNRVSLKSKLDKYLYLNIHASNIDSLPIPTPLMENSIVLTLLDLGIKQYRVNHFQQLRNVLFAEIYSQYGSLLLLHTLIFCKIECEIMHEIVYFEILEMAKILKILKKWPRLLVVLRHNLLQYSPDFNFHLCLMSWTVVTPKSFG